MKRAVITSTLFLVSFFALSQGFKTFNYYRIEAKSDGIYMAIELQGQIQFTKHSIIVKDNAGIGETVLIIDGKTAESKGKIVYNAHFALRPDMVVYLEVSKDRVIVVMPELNEGVMFLNKSVKRPSLPSKGVWYQKIKEVDRHI